MNFVRQSNRTSIFVQGDPLSAFLLGRIGLRPEVIALGILLLLDAPIILIAFTNNLWSSSPGRLGLLEDYSWWILQITSLPATIFYFFWMPQGVLEVMRELDRNQVIPHSRRHDSESYSLDDFLVRFDKFYSHRAWMLIGIVCVAAYVLLFIAPDQKAFKTWQTSGQFIFWYTEFFWVCVYSLGAMIAIRTIIVLVWFRRLFTEFRINVQVLFPDGAGGLSPLGKYVVSIGYMLGLFGLAAVLASLTGSYQSTPFVSKPVLLPSLAPQLAAYFILAVLVFLAPISIAHSTMKAAKYEFALMVSAEFENERSKLRSILRSNRRDLEIATTRMELLVRIHVISSRFPLWPFNVESIISFGSSVLTPIALNLIAGIIGKYI